MSEVKLGHIVRDSISGFEGVVNGMTYWLYGCVRASVCPTKLKKDSAELPTSEWFDVRQLDVVGVHASCDRDGVPEVASPANPAGPRDNDPGQNDPR